MAVSAATLALLLAAPVAWAASDVAHQYCLVGAGPGGLQLGHYMMKAGRDYMVYERNARAGSFFETYPIHRGLISLNKRNKRFTIFGPRMASTLLTASDGRGQPPLTC